MAISQQKSGLTGRLIMNPLMFKNPYGVLGRRENVSVPAINTPANETNLMETGRGLSPIDIPGLTGLADGGGNGPSASGSPQGSTTAGQAAVQSANSEQNAMSFGKGALGVGAGIVGPSVIGSIAQQSPNLGLASALGYTAAVAKGLISAHPALGIANIGFTAAAQAMAQADMADAIDSGEMDESDVGLMNSLSSNVHSGAEMVNMDEIGPKATKSIASAREARNNPISFSLGRALSGLKSGDFGKAWSNTSLMDNIARETLTPGSTESPDRGGTLSQPQTLGEDNTYSNIGPALNNDTRAQAQDMADAAANLGKQAQAQGMVDAENNSIDGGYFSGFDPGVGVSSGDAGMGGFGDSVGSEGE